MAATRETFKSKENVTKKFATLNGVGNAKAELLYTSGFDSIDKLKNATVDDLKNIKGITEKNAKDILNQLKKPEKKETAKAKPKTQEKPKETKKEKTPAPTEEKSDEDQIGTIEETVEIVGEDKEETYKAKKKPKLSGRTIVLMHISSVVTPTG